MSFEKMSMLNELWFRKPGSVIFLATSGCDTASKLGRSELGDFA